MPATLTEEEILRRLEVCKISFVSWVLLKANGKETILIDVSKTVFMLICSIISCLCVGGTLVFSCTTIIRRIIVSRTMTI